MFTNLQTALAKLTLSLISLHVALAAGLTATYTVLPPTAPETVVSGSGWSYTVPFPVHNADTIEKLIQCESEGVNVARPDSNGLISWGILQFNGTSTWAEAERQFNYHGSPMIPSDAIHMADMMIDAGELRRWTCARLVGFLH